MFLFLDRVWQESTYEKGTPTVDIVYLSNAYVELLDWFPEIAPILALGEKVVFKLSSAWVRIGVEGLTEITSEVLRQLLR